MKIAAGQFAVTGSMAHNLREMRRLTSEAASAGAELLLFPECALTGYPPRDLPAAAAADRRDMDAGLSALSALARETGTAILAGTILPGDGGCTDSAVLLTPDGVRQVYHKQALWGWDRENFTPGTGGGIFAYSGLRLGVRICFEVRFPEYFRALYRARTDLNLLLFYDAGSRADPDRRDLIRAHVRTRAVENACPILCANTTGPHQTAPTGFYDASGRPLRELTPGEPGLLLWDFQPSPPGFGEQGRREISDRLLGLDPAVK